MSLVRDIIDRDCCFPNRELHVIPVLDGAFAPNQRLDHARNVGGEIERPDDLALGPDGAFYVSSGTVIVRCAGEDYAERAPFAKFESTGRRSCLVDRRTPAGLCLRSEDCLRCPRAARSRGQLETVDGRRSICPTAVAVADDGTIYVTDGSRAQSARTLARLI